MCIVIYFFSMLVQDEMSVGLLNKNHALSNYFLHKILSTDYYTKPLFRGFLFPRDNPDILEKIKKISPPSIFVVNTDFIKEPGLHWVLVIYLKNITLWLDPFGLPSLIYNLPIIVERKNIPVTRNIFTVQNFDTRSITCGHFVLIYALLIARGYNFVQINNIFTENTELNDFIAIEVITWLNQQLLVK